MKLIFTVLVTLIFMSSCSKNIPENWPQCTSDFKPDSLLYANHTTLNPCQFVYEGFFDLEKNTSEINCITNPTNWTIEIKENQGNQRFEISVFHEPIPFELLVEGGNYGLCFRDLVFDDEHKFCEIEIERRCYGISGSDRSWVAVHPTPEFWECYEEGVIEFRVTAKMEMPVDG